MSCSCGCTPCGCPTSGEIDASECLDPGIVRTGTYASVLTEDMCERRLASFRGFKDDGTLETRTSVPLKAAVMTQDAEGVVSWSDSPCNDPTEKMARVANDEQAAITTNYVPKLLAKGDAGCDVSLVGSDDESSGQWKLVWVASMQKWTTVPDLGDGEFTSDLCTTLVASVVIDPDTESYVLNVGSSSLMAVGVSVKVQTYELVITEIIDEDYVRAELVTDIGGPTTIFAGESLCNIGFRPCPRSAAPYADNLVACLAGSAVSIEFPADVNSVPVPGMWWRDQLGRVAFLAAPVNGTTGLVEPNYALSTPTTPVAGQANTPTFKVFSQKPTWLGTKVQVATKIDGAPAGPTFANEDDMVAVAPYSGTYNMAGGTVPGYVAGSSVAILRAVCYADTIGATEALAQVIVNGLVLSEAWIDSGNSFGFQNSNVFEAPLTDDKFTYEVKAVGDAVSFAKLEIIGWK